MANAVADLSNDFDIDSFDWGDEEVTPIPYSDIADNLEEVLHDCIAHASVQRYSWRYAKPGELRNPNQKIYHVKYVMENEEDRTFFEKTWPEYVFMWAAATKHTDHPVSRLTRELNELEMVHPFVSQDKPYIDLFGSGSRNEHYGRKCITLYAKATPKDFLSYQNPTVGEQILDWDKLVRGDYRWKGERIHDVTMTHSLYYLNLGRIGEFVCAHPRNRVHALVHRHSQSYGTLNCGEQKYWVSEDGTVTQMNALTGESYSHRSLESMFHQYSAKVRAGGVAWTSRKLGGDTFLIELVGCDKELAGDYIPLVNLNPETRTITSTVNLEVRTFLHWTWLSYKWEGRTRLLENIELVDALRLYIAGKPRTARERTSLWNYAKRLCNERDLLSMHGGKVHKIDQAIMADYVSCAFYMDARQELEVAVSYAKENAQIIDALNDYYENGKMPKNYATVERAVVAVATVITKPITWPAQKCVELDRMLEASDKNRDNRKEVANSRKRSKASKLMTNIDRLKLEPLAPLLAY